MDDASVFVKLELLGSNEIFFFFSFLNFYTLKV